MKNLVIIFISILWFLNFSANAQKKWTLQQCVDSAINNNLNIKQYQNSVLSGKYNYQQSKYNLLPTFDGTGSESYNYQFSQNSGSTSRNRWSSSFGVSGNMTLFNGFQNQYAIKESEANYKSAGFDLENYKNKLIIDIVNAYLQILYSNEAIKNAENQVVASNQQVQTTTAFVETGKQPENNLLIVKAQLATDKLTLVNAKNQLRTAKLNLQQLMEIPSTEDFDIVYYDNLPIPLMINENVASIYNTSLVIMPVVQSYQQKVIAEQYSLKSLKNAWMPRLSLNANISTNYSSASGIQLSASDFSSSFGSQISNNLGSTISLTLSIPIFSKMQNSTNVKLQEIRLQNTILNQKSENNTLRKEIEQAYNDLINAMAKYEAINEQLSSTKKSYENSKTRYENGLLSATDLLVEKNKLIKAESDLLQSKYDLIFKWKILDYYKGQKITIQ